jgi:prolipoprotein diacylglyceryltransferase
LKIIADDVDAGYAVSIQSRVAFLRACYQVTVNGFSLWIGLGASLGLWRVWRSAPDHQANAWVNAGIAVLAAALAGARLFYSLENWPYFISHPAEIFRLWEGGLAWEGALTASAVGIWLIANSRRGTRSHHLSENPLGVVGDRLYPLLPPLAVMVWVGCWQTGAAHGAIVPDGTWWGISGVDAVLGKVRYFPLQPLAALTLLPFFWVLETRVKPLHPPGKLSGIAIFGLLAHLLATTLLNASPSPTWNGARIDTWFALASLILFIAIFLAVRLNTRMHRRQTTFNS